MSNLVNPSFAIPGYANIRYTEAASPSAELRFLDGAVMATAILDLDAPTVALQQYRLSGTISGLAGTIGNTPSVTFVTTGGNLVCNADGPFSFVYTAYDASDQLLVRATSRTVGAIGDLVHEPYTGS